MLLELQPPRRLSPAISIVILSALFPRLLSPLGFWRRPALHTGSPPCSLMRALPVLLWVCWPEFWEEIQQALFPWTEELSLQGPLASQGPCPAQALGLCWASLLCLLGLSRGLGVLAQTPAV